MSHTPAFAAFAVAALLSGCLHVPISATDLMHPDEPPQSATLAPGYVVEDFTIPRGDRVVALTLAHRAGNRSVILFCGGDSFRRSQEGGSVLNALGKDADVLLFDYPGFGTSSGRPDPATLMDNARAAADFLAALPSTAGQRRVLYGFSLGGFVASHLAADRSFDGLVLEATAPDVGRWARSQIPWFAKPFVRVELDPALARIDNIAALRTFSGQVLILAGGRDRQAPPSLARSLERSLRASGHTVDLHVFASATHGEIHRDGAYPAVLARFLALTGRRE